MSTYYVGSIPVSDELYHYGILGQKWGIRRYQNEDGSYTPAGKERYARDLQRMAQKDAQRVSDAKAAYGEGAGVRRRLIDKEINEKRKNKDYAKAFDQASKNVSVAKSLKRAEKLNRNSGLFVRGRDLTDGGKTAAGEILKGVGGAAIGAISSTISYKMWKDIGMDWMANASLAVGAMSVGTNLYTGVRRAASIGYYNKNKKF